jgi:hypothetical protein
MEGVVLMRGIGTFLTKALVAGVIIFVGVTGGSYVGSKLRSNASHGLSPKSLRNDTSLYPGETFPPFGVVLQNADENTTIQELVLGHPAVLAFVRPECDPCKEMVAYWNNRIVNTLRDEIQLVFIIGKGDSVSTEAGAGFDIPGAIVCYSERTSDAAVTGIYATPTLVALDEAGVIAWISTGYSRRIDGAFLNRHL